MVNTLSKNIRLRIPMRRSDLSDYNDAYIVVKDTINLRLLEKIVCLKQYAYVILKSNVPFNSGLAIAKINNLLLDNAEELNMVMLIYNLLEYSNNYSMRAGRLLCYYRVEIDDV